MSTVAGALGEDSAVSGPGSALAITDEIETPARHRIRFAAGC